MDLVIKKGKFYRGEELVPLEHGNMEQITLMRKKTNYINSFREKGFVPKNYVESTFTLNIFFTCPLCDKAIQSEYEVEDEFDYLDDVVGEELKCKSCRGKFFLLENEYGDVAIKLRENE